MRERLAPFDAGKADRVDPGGKGPQAGKGPLAS
jgi:hypothetical protein